jgi:hypothetical protein
MTFIKYSLLSRGRDTVRAANRRNARSQAELGGFHFVSAQRLDILQGAPADDHVVAARWSDALRFNERAAEQGVAGAQDRWIAEAQLNCGFIYAAGDRSVPQNWATAAKWWRKAAEAGDEGAQWFIGLCYYYGRGVDRDVAQAKIWFRKSAATTAQGNRAAAEAVQAGIPGDKVIRDLLARFTNAVSAPLLFEVAHEFAGMMVEHFLGPQLQAYSRQLQEDSSAAPHPSVRDSLWVDFVMTFGLSNEELALAKRIHAYSLRTCTFCGSNSAPLRHCSLCMEVHYCIVTDCQYQAWN